MKYRLILGIGLLLAILSAWSAASPWSANAQATCPAPVLLGAQGAAATTSNLLVLNPATGAVTTTIGPTGVALTGLAQNPVDGRVYGATASLSTVAPRSLVRITGTGTAVVIGSFGLPGTQTLADLTFDNAGTLYGWNSVDDNLYRVNLTTGAATLVGLSGIVPGLGLPAGSGLTFASGVIFVSDSRDNGLLRRINPPTGALISSTPLVGGVGLPVGALAANPNNTNILYGARINNGVTPRTADLITIDATTGAVTTVGASINQLDALAFVCLPDLAIAKSDAPDPVLTGGNLTYTVTVTNNGTAAGFPATNTTVTDTLPPGVIFGTATPTQGSCSQAAGIVTCNLGSLGAGATATVTIVVQPTAAGTISNTASVVSDLPEANTANNTITISTTVVNPTATPTATATSTSTPTPTSTATSTVTPTATPTRIPGDYNRDGFVDLLDYGVWRQNFGQTNCGNPADGDGNCLVDIRDYGIWRQHFGEGIPPDRRGGGSLTTGIALAPAPAPRRPPGPTSPTGVVPAVDFTATEQSAEASDQASEGSWSLLRAEGVSPAVPVIPEADGLSLLASGLVGLGMLSGWRRRRPPPGRPRPPRKSR